MFKAIIHKFLMTNFIILNSFSWKCVILDNYLQLKIINKKITSIEDSWKDTPILSPKKKNLSHSDVYKTFFLIILLVISAFLIH